jgi:hypothetical protein
MQPLHERLYDLSIYASYILYVLILFGVTNYAPSYLEWLKNAIKIYIAVLLIWRFNPFFSNGNKCGYLSTFDRKIVFSSGVFLLLTTSVTSIIEYVIKDTPLSIIQI